DSECAGDTHEVPRAVRLAHATVNDSLHGDRPRRDDGARSPAAGSGVGAESPSALVSFYSRGALAVGFGNAHVGRVIRAAAGAGRLLDPGGGGLHRAACARLRSFLSAPVVGLEYHGCDVRLVLAFAGWS